MTLPSKVRVGARWYSVEVVEAMLDKCYGRVYYDKRMIHVHKRKRTGMEDTFWHETVHAILHDMEHPLYRYERFVTAFADRLSKAIRSVKFT